MFVKASTGFKAGGFDSIGTYRPETNTAFEAGWKQSFGDSSQHQFNLGAFYYDYKDLQVSVLLDTAVGGQTFNAGKAKIWGLEASADIKLSDNDDDFWVAQARRANVLLAAPGFSAVIVATNGTMARMNTVHPMTFVAFKRWLAQRPDRDPLKTSRDQLQADTVEQLVGEYLPQLVALASR